MKYIKVVALIITFFVLNSCGKNVENLSNAAKQISAYCNTKDVVVNTTTVSHVGNKTVKNYTIIIKNVKQVEENNYPAMLIASHCAKLLYEAITPEERNNKEAINVKIVRNGGEEQFSYPISEIKETDRYINIAKQSILKLKNKDYEGFYNSYIDKTVISKEIFYANLIENVVKPDQKIFDNIKDIEIAGFNFRKEGEFDLIEIYAATTVGDTKQNYQVVFKKGKKPKIAGISIRV